MLLHWQVCNDGLLSITILGFLCLLCPDLRGTVGLKSYLLLHVLLLNFAEGHQALLFAFWYLCTQVHVGLMAEGALVL